MIVGDKMNNINYNQNADSQLNKYDLAIENINLAIKKLDGCIEELKKILESRE